MPVERFRLVRSEEVVRACAQRAAIRASSLNELFDRFGIDVAMPEESFREVGELQPPQNVTYRRSGCIGRSS